MNHWLCLTCGRRLGRTRARITAAMKPPACPEHGARPVALRIEATGGDGTRLTWRTEWTLKEKS
jgi:hypothetical protein